MDGFLISGSATPPPLQAGTFSRGVVTMRCDLSTCSSAHISLLVSGSAETCFDDQVNIIHAGSSKGLMLLVEVSSLWILSCFYMCTAFGISYKERTYWKKPARPCTAQLWGKQAISIWASEICFDSLWGHHIWSVHESSYVGFTGYFQSNHFCHFVSLRDSIRSLSFLFFPLPCDLWLMWLWFGILTPERAPVFLSCRPVCWGMGTASLLRSCFHLFCLIFAQWHGHCILYLIVVGRACMVLWYQDTPWIWQGHGFYT